MFKAFFSKLAMANLRYLENAVSVLRDIDYAYPEDMEYYIYEGGVEVNYNRELKRLNKQEWKQRDKFQTKVPRRAPRMSIRR